jgi:hypothetical protein
MKAVEFWFWNIESETRPGKRIKSVCRMTRAQALDVYGDDIGPVPNSCEVRNLPENDEEMRQANSHSINTGAYRSK